MPVSIHHLTGGGYSVSTPHGTKAKHTTKEKAKKQEHLLNAVEHGWKPTHKGAADMANLPAAGSMNPTGALLGKKMSVKKEPAIESDIMKKGFVERAMQYGATEAQALAMLKAALVANATNVPPTNPKMPAAQMPKAMPAQAAKPPAPKPMPAAQPAGGALNAAINQGQTQVNRGMAAPVGGSY